MRRRADAGLLGLWMVVWTAMIIVAVWMLGSAALRGEIGAAAILAAWVAAAGFGLLVTLIWLYLEVLRLLAKLRRE